MARDQEISKAVGARGQEIDVGDLGGVAVDAQREVVRALASDRMAGPGQTAVAVERQEAAVTGLERGAVVLARQGCQRLTAGAQRELLRSPWPAAARVIVELCLLYTSPSPRDRTRSRMPSSA